MSRGLLTQDLKVTVQMILVHITLPPMIVLKSPSIHRSHFHFQKQNLAKKIDAVKHHGSLNFPDCIMMQSKFIPYIWLLEKLGNANRLFGKTGFFLFFLSYRKKISIINLKEIAFRYEFYYV